MKHLTFRLFAVAMLAAMFFGCESEDPVSPQAPIGKPTNVMLQKLTANSFSVSWLRADNDDGTDTVTIIRTAPTTAQWRLAVGAPTSVLDIQDTSITITGGSFTVTVASKDSTSDPATLTITNKQVPAPTNLQVTSISSTEIGVRWTRSSAEDGVDTIIAKDASSGAIVVAKPVILSTPAWLLTGLSPNVKYQISVRSSSGNSSPAIEWATATRSEMMTLYETAVPNNATHPSGLVLGPIAHTAAIDGTEQSLIDLVLATDFGVPQSFIAVQGADVVGSGIPSGRASLVGNNAFSVKAGLDGDFYTTDFAGEFTSNFNSQPIPGTTSDPFIILVKTTDKHYARVQIVPQSNGLLWKDVTIGASSYRAIDVIVSYQPIADAPYASRPGQIRRGTNEPKVSGSKVVRKY